MSSLRKIICLANSEKLQERCIAGIEINTGKWIRPVCDKLYPNDGRVPSSVRLINGDEPNLLDILEIPLAETGKDFGFECENLSVLEGEWQHSGRAQLREVFLYHSSFPDILHNSSKYVNPSYLESLPFSSRRTLQLVQTNHFTVEQKPGSTGWRGTLQTSNGKWLRDAKITDPVFVKKLNDGHAPQQRCLVTVSLSMPWAPGNDWEGEEPCWKLIAGVIEL